jgi:flagellar basal body-associated protein FliL
VSDPFSRPDKSQPREFTNDTIADLQHSLFPPTNADAPYSKSTSIAPRSPNRSLVISESDEPIIEEQSNKGWQRITVISAIITLLAMLMAGYIFYTKSNLSRSGSIVYVTATIPDSTTPTPSVQASTTPQAGTATSSTPTVASGTAAPTATSSISTPTAVSKTAVPTATSSLSTPTAVSKTSTPSSVTIDKSVLELLILIIIAIPVVLLLIYAILALRRSFSKGSSERKPQYIDSDISPELKRYLSAPPQTLELPSRSSASQSSASQSPANQSPTNQSPVINSQPQPRTDPDKYPSPPRKPEITQVFSPPYDLMTSHIFDPQNDHIIWLALDLDGDSKDGVQGVIVTIAYALGSYALATAHLRVGLIASGENPLVLMPRRDQLQRFQESLSLVRQGDDSTLMNQVDQVREQLIPGHILIMLTSKPSYIWTSWVEGLKLTGLTVQVLQVSEGQSPLVLPTQRSISEVIEHPNVDI